MHQRGFTLAELIVVVAVLIILLTLTALASGCAIQDGRQRVCEIQLQKISLALHNYHDTYARLPAGAHNRSVPPQFDKASWGPSWIVSILPYVEQKEELAAEKRKLRESMVVAIHADAANDYISPPVLKAAAVDPLSTFICPVSPLPATQTIAGNELAVPSYAGIMGAKLPNDKRFVAGPFGGFAAGNGMLLINRHSRIAECQDGTSNTIIVGEVSNWYYDDAGKRRNPSLSIADAGDGVQAGAGWPAGNSLNFIVNPDDKDFSGQNIQYEIKQGSPAIEANRVCNVIAIDQPAGANNRGGRSDNSPNWGSGGVGRCGFNNPLLSPHNGALALHLGGEVKLYSPEVDSLVLRKLAVRDDGSAEEGK